MKKIVLGLLTVFVGSLLFTSCSTESNVLSQFSKRKYVKSFKKAKVKTKVNIEEYENTIDYDVAINTYASKDNNVAKVNEINVTDNSVLPVEEEEVKTFIKNTTAKDYSEWNNYNREMDFSKISETKKNEIAKHFANHSNNRGGVSDPIVLAILCVFVPPLAVYLYEDSIGNNFWIDLILTFLFWIPGMIFAFLVVFDVI